MRVVLVLAAALVTLIAPTEQAYAQSSAVDQYVEDLPTDQGSAVPGQGGSTPAPPSRSVSDKIEQEGGADAEALKTIVSSPDYGAPVRPKKTEAAGAKREIRAEDVPPAGTDSSAGEALSAAASAVEGGDAARLVGLLAVLLAISIAALTAAGLRQKHRVS